jgi:hypothetical protein
MELEARGTSEPRTWRINREKVYHTPVTVHKGQYQILYRGTNIQFKFDARNAAS